MEESSNHPLSYEEWVADGCTSDKWSKFAGRKSYFVMSVIRIVASPFLTLWNIIRFKAEEYCLKLSNFFRRGFLGYSYEESACGYYCAQECYRTLIDVQIGCDLCRLLFCIRDALWCINPISKLSYQLALVDLTTDLTYFLDEMDFAVEILENMHTFEEVDEHRKSVNETTRRVCSDFSKAFRRKK